MRMTVSGGALQRDLTSTHVHAHTHTHIHTQMYVLLFSDVNKGSTHKDKEKTKLLRTRMRKRRQGERPRSFKDVQIALQVLQTIIGRTAAKSHSESKVEKL